MPAATQLRSAIPTGGQQPGRSTASPDTPSHYESAGKRRDGGISREGFVELRRALLDLGVGLWHSEPAARCYATRLRQRGKPGGIIATAMARIAGRLAYAMVRDQTAYDPTQRRNEIDPRCSQPRTELAG